MYFMSAIMAPIGGFFMDKFGLFTGMYLAVASLFLGQLFICLAVYMNSFTLMLTGRLIFGLGLEPLNSHKNIVVTKWFIGGELSLAHNLNLAVSRMFVFFNGYATPYLTESYGYRQAFVFGLVFITVSFLSTIPVANLHRRLNDENNTA